MPKSVDTKPPRFMKLGNQLLHIRSLAICGYDIWCPKCKYKSATWTVDNPTSTIIKDAFQKQFEQVIALNHMEHGTITIINDYTRDLSPEEREQYLGDRKVIELSEEMKHVRI